ncbi:hypothetical protein JZ751_029574 [Albula glossodonta]|uniref:C-type lectin domain-containing protein n=1 Tax=Albula glossodonta TaxID=121402 RepID=A0A8T2MQC1_9TELE|nr:hypothetical protein JZ751_029574 [Albula glossodonta]
MKAASALVLVFLLVSVAAMTIEKRLKKFFPPVCKKANGTNWYKVGSYCVKYFKGPVEFGTAETNCAKDAPGGHLASVHSVQANDDFHNIIMKYSPNNPRTWIGGLEIPSTKTYIWTDASPWNYQAWESGEPGSWFWKSEHCVEMDYNVNKKWYDSACNTKLGYMCAYKLQAATEGGGQE